MSTADPTVMSPEERAAESYLSDPLMWGHAHWPDMLMYPRQAEILYSVRDNFETFVPAANKLGKTRAAAFIALWWFATRNPARVILTSSSEGQLKDVLWSEISLLMSTSRQPMPFNKTHLELHLYDDGDSGLVRDGHYMIGRVTNNVERFAGHHLPFLELPRVLFIFEEASGIPDEFYEAAQSQAHRILCIGNPLNTNNFFYRKCKAGDAEASSPQWKLDRKVIHISAFDSPNVQAGLHKLREAREAGVEGPVSAPTPMPGILTWMEFLYRMANWDADAIKMRVKGEFLDEGQTLLITPATAERAAQAWWLIMGQKRGPYVIGVDVAMGGRDKSVWCVADRLGVVQLLVKDTPNTMLICGVTKNLMAQYNVPGKRVGIDIGGGKSVCDRLHEIGRLVQEIAFGTTADNSKVYKNKRAEMYGSLASLMDVSTWSIEYDLVESDDEDGDDVEGEVLTKSSRCFAIPPDDAKLREELTAMPRLWDSEGKMFLPPKERSNDSKQKTIRELIGRSPDRADACAIAAEMLRRMDVGVVKQLDVSKIDPKTFKVDLSWSKRMLGG